MTKIVATFPCMGKSHYAKENPNAAIDLESSLYMFSRKGFEHLSVEEFKGIREREPIKNGMVHYLKAILETCHTGQYDYVFIASFPNLLKSLALLDKDIYVVTPYPNMRSQRIYSKRAITRGNRQEWVEAVIPWLHHSTAYPKELLNKIHVVRVPAGFYLKDVIEHQLI